MKLFTLVYIIENLNFYFGGLKMKFTILHTNDVHSRFENFARISTKIKKMRDDSTIVLDAGDFHDFMDLMLQGTNGQAGSKLLKEAGYDALAIGNNEMFEGLETMRYMTSSTDLPFVSCNLVRKDGSDIEGIRKSIIVEKSGVRFLVIGASPDFKMFLDLMDMGTLPYKEAIQKEIDDNKGKYDVCILLSHLGLREDEELLESVKGIDIVIDGHSHVLMDNPEVINGVTVHMSGCYGEYLGRVTFEYDGHVHDVKAENIKVHDEEMDENILELMGTNRKEAIDNLSEPLYSIDRDLYHDIVEENPMTNFLADAVKDCMKTDLGIINSGVINGGIRKGVVTMKKLIEICPSPLNPTYMEVKGKNIKEALNMSLDHDLCYKDGRGGGFRGKYLGRLHVSGAVIEHDGKNVKHVLINGKEIEDEKYYSVATSDYLERGDWYTPLAEHRNVRYDIDYLRITLKKYLCRKEFLDKAFVDRWIEE